MRKIEHIIENFLWQSRFFLLIAIISSVISAILLLILGTLDIIILIKKIIFLTNDYNYLENVQKEALAKIIGAIDYYLIATVLIIFGLGLYELFISKIDKVENDIKSSRILVIHSLDQLKDKIAKVIIMVLIVTFFKYSIGQKEWNMSNLLYLSIGILFISLALFLINFKKSHNNEKDEQ